MSPVEELIRLLQSGRLSPKNTERAARVFYDAAKILHYRQKRLNKPQLKMKEVSSAIVLAESLHSQAFRFEATGSLAECFGGNFDEGSALNYYEQRVMGSVNDKFGRTITLDEDGMRSLYKDRQTGKHEESPDNYEQVRGKRLPWIRHTLLNSDALYVSEEIVMGQFRRSFLYSAIVSIPIKPKPQVSYYIVVVRE